MTDATNTKAITESNSKNINNDKKITNCTNVFNSKFLGADNSESQVAIHISKETDTTISNMKYVQKGQDTSDSKKYSYITTPIYYVNDKPHIGHMYTSIAADIYNRFKILDGFSAKFATGTDEHGQKILKKATEQGISPKELVDKVSKTFKNLTPILNLSNTDFIRTTEKHHTLAVQHLWTTLEKKGYIYLDKYSGWYAVQDEAYYVEEELTTNSKGEKIAPSGAHVTWQEESSYFFKLSEMQNELLQYYDNNPEFIAPKSRYNEIYSFVKGGLRDLSISRSSFNWGISVPMHHNNSSTKITETELKSANKHIVYVWLDALTNYLSVLGYPNTHSANFKNYWQEAIHIVGKDITRFHCVYFPAFLLAAGLPLPKRIFAHGWWLNEGKKISKSLGNTISPEFLIKKYGLDQSRYFLFKEITFGNDGNFSHSAMVNRINNELANEYGNLLQRSASIIHKHFQGKLLYTDLNNVQQEKLQELNNLLPQLQDMINEQDFSNYLEKIWQQIRFANSYINDVAPWRLIKAEQKKQAGQELYFIIEIIRRITIFLQPFMPNATTKIFQQLNIKPQNFTQLSVNLIKEHNLNTISPIFSKYEDDN